VDKIWHSHYDLAMKKVPSGIVPMITINRKASKALHRQIYDAYREAIVERRLRPRQRVPSSRSLAIELGISRFPVLNAYAQLLAEGYFESRVGAGTIVSRSFLDPLTPSKPIAARLAPTSSGDRPISRRSLLLPRLGRAPWLRGGGAFGVGQVAFDEFPLRIWSNLVARHCRKMAASSFHYGDHKGSAALRETIASYLRTARSLRCEADQIIIVSGSQQALDLTARVLLDPGSRVWVENPGYLLAREVFALADCRLVPVPVDEEGLDVAAGIRRCAKARAALVTPSHQFPLGVTMSASRRLHLLDWAQKYGSWIIEDDYDSEYRYESQPIASMQGLDENARVIYIGTFSKVLNPTLRLGYLVLPPDLVDRFGAVRHAVDICPPGFHQEVVADFIGEGHFGRHIRRMRVLYQERRKMLADRISREFGALAEVLGSAAGMHLTVALPNGTRDVEIAERASSQKLWTWPLSRCYVGEPARQGFVLGYGSTAVADIPSAVRALRNLLSGQSGVAGPVVRSRRFPRVR
jgi:GntR family transcriptional regulator/MocR family aminotransferase